MNVISASDMSRLGSGRGMGCGCMIAASGIGQYLAGVNILHTHRLSWSLPEILLK